MRSKTIAALAGALIATSFLAAPDTATAAPCGTTTLDVWLGIPGFSCTVGDKTFGNFLYQQDGFNGTNGHTNVPASSVGVGPSNLSAGPGLVFNAFWSNSGTTTADAFISFTVTAPASAPISDFHLLLDGVVGSVLDVGSLSNGVTLSSSDNLEHSISFAPVISLLVQDDIGVNPGGTVSSMHKAFSEVPLPGALPLFATGLAGLGLLGWRRKRKAAA